MAEHTGYDQPGDPYTYKNDGSPPPYQPPFPQPQTGFTQSYQNNTTVVVSQQPQPGGVIIQARPPDYRFASLFACLFCFCPTGLCAIHYAAEANNLADAGDYEGAKRMSDNAKNLVITSILLGILIAVICVLLRFLAFQGDY